jgi:hypothetical protein
VIVLENKYKTQCKMPTLLKKGQKQFTTFEANETRLVTKVRWVVEAVNNILNYSNPTYQF